MRCIEKFRTPALLILFVLLANPHPTLAQRKVADHRSKNFLVHTDLPEKDAEALLEKFESMLAIISEYWGVKNRKTIECYVVRDLKNFNTRRFAPNVLQSLKNGGGLTVGNFQRRGNQTRVTAIAYAIANGGTPQHEALHAYCYQNFGHVGPSWYAEGMAEMGKYWDEKDPTVTCPKYITNYLRTSRRPTVNSLVASGNVRLGNWQQYAWRWALCHMLARNTNYADRFRPLGIGLLNKRRGASFSRTYSSKLDEIEFEYAFFIQNIEPGFDVRRASWDWETTFKHLKVGRQTTATVDAERGWQGSGVKMKKGEKYSFVATGTWQLTKDGEKLTADGTAEKLGQLQALVFDNFALSRSFELGANGEFTAPGDGQMYVRCADSFSKLSDNSGKISVEFTRLEPTSETDKK